MPLRSTEYYSDRRIELALNSRAVSLDVRRKQVRTDGGKTYDFDRMLLATGAEPVRLPIAGARESELLYLRTYSDGRALTARAASAKQVVVLGGSFITASLRARGIGVHVVARERLPLEQVMGPEVGRFIRGLHESQGVVFHLEDTVTRLEGHTAHRRNPRPAHLGLAAHSPSPRPRHRSGRGPGAGCRSVGVNRRQRSS